jgi:hypothetical protein
MTREPKHPAQRFKRFRHPFHLNTHDCQQRGTGVPHD